MPRRLANEGKATFLLVHATKDRQKMLDKLEALHVTLPSATDDYEAHRKAYCAAPLPRTFVISAPKGTVQAIFSTSDEQGLRDAIKAAAAAKN
jgi:hypothetical protein